MIDHGQAPPKALHIGCRQGVVSSGLAHAGFDVRGVGFGQNDGYPYWMDMALLNSGQKASIGQVNFGPTLANVRRLVHEISRADLVWVTCDNLVDMGDIAHALATAGDGAAGTLCASSHSFPASALRRLSWRAETGREAGGVREEIAVPEARPHYRETPWVVQWQPGSPDGWPWQARGDEVVEGDEVLYGIHGEARAWLEAVGFFRAGGLRCLRRGPAWASPEGCGERVSGTEGQHWHGEGRGRRSEVVALIDDPFHSAAGYSLARARARALQAGGPFGSESPIIRGTRYGRFNQEYGGSRDVWAWAPDESGDPFAIPWDVEVGGWRSTAPFFAISNVFGRATPQKDSVRCHFVGGGEGGALLQHSIQLGFGVYAATEGLPRTLELADRSPWLSDEEVLKYSFCGTARAVAMEARAMLDSSRRRGVWNSSPAG